MSLFAALGNIEFQALVSPETLETSEAWKFAEQPTVESSPKLQWIGNELSTIELEILLHVSIADPAADLASLRAAGNAHQAMALVFGNGDHLGYYVIEKLKTSSIKRAGDGSIIAITAKLELKQWVRSVEVDPNAPPQPAATPPGIIVGDLQPGQSVAGVIAADGTVTFPAPQAGVSATVNNPAAAGAPTPGADPDSVPTSTIVRMDPDVGAVLA